jgi:hypothetical protein
MDMKKLLGIAVALLLMLALASCGLSEQLGLSEFTDEAAEIPMIDEAKTRRADVYSADELYHHLMYAASEGYSTVVFRLHLPQEISVKDLWADRSIRFVGNDIKYYVLQGEDGETFSDQTLLLEIPPYVAPPERTQEPPREDQLDPKWRNVISILRREAIEKSPHRRSETFEDFAIYRENRGEMMVRDSEQLWIALEKNYMPVFPERRESEAEKIWNAAADVLRQIITEDMDVLQKLSAIYDYLCESVQYDHHLALAGQSHRTDAAHYPEGVLNGRFAVCDGIAKTAVILCRMEGIPCLMVEGKGERGGHAWNAVQYEGQWYTFCATYGMMTADETSGLAQLFGGRVGWSSYRTFMAPLSYMDEQFPDQSCPDLAQEDRTVALDAPMARPVHPDVALDFDVESIVELEMLFADLVNGGITGPYFMELTSDLLPMNMEMISMAAHRSDPFASVVLYRHTDAIGKTRYTVFVR